MSDLNVKSDSVDVEQIMKQIRSRIREKRGSDYTETELQQLASAKFEQFADPSGLRSDLLEQFRKRGDEPSTYHRHRGIRRLLLMMVHPVLKRVQKQVMSDLNLYFEIIHNLVIEVTKLGVENHNLKMKVESLSSRLDFDERRGRALEGAVQYRQPRHHQPHQAQQQQPPPQQQHRPAAPQPASPAPVQASATVAATQVVSTVAAPLAQGEQPAPGQPGQEGAPRGDGSGRRRRRRRRRRPGSALAESPNAPASEGAGGNDAGDHGDDGDDGAADQ
jgi:biotin carboxyl carrier protein